MYKEIKEFAFMKINFAFAKNKFAFAYLIFAFAYPHPYEGRTKPLEERLKDFPYNASE
jgi:hypothetical protein